MTNAIYPDALQGFLAAEIDWDGAAIKAALVHGYTYSASHKFMSDVTGAGGTVTAASAALTTKTTVAGAAGADNETLSAVTATASNHVIIVYQSSAVTGGSDVAATAQRVIAYIDSGTNFPIVPNGGDVTIAWASGVVFTL